MNQRDINKIDKTILKNFYKLVHTQPNVRLTAASSTFKILEALRRRSFQAFNENLNYSIDRLVIGLSSNRALARRGYGTLLLEILNSHQVSNERLLGLAQQKFGQISKETSRDNLLGYFLLASIILKSGNFKQNKSNAQCLEKIYKILIQLQSTKSYLDFSVSRLLVEHHSTLHQAMVADINPHAFESDVKLPSFDLLIIILCHRVEPVRGLLNLDNASLIDLFSVITDEKYLRRPLHPIFIESSQFVIENFPQQFATFYTKILFPIFFKANHNELAAMGLELTSILINKSDNLDSIKILLNEHVIRLLIISLRNRNSFYQHSVAFFKSLSEVESITDDKLFTIIDKFTNSPGSISFDEDSKSKSINSLLSNASSIVLKKYLDKLMVSSLKKNDQTQHSSARQIAFLVSRPQMVEDQATMTKAAKFLMVNSMFKPTKIDQVDETFWKSEDIPRPVIAFEGPTRRSFQNAYRSTLDHIVSACSSIQRLDQLRELVNFCDRLLKLVSLEHVGQDEKSEKPVKELWPIYFSFLADHMKLIKQQENPKQLYPITCLFLFYGLQVVEHELDCKSQLEELAQSAEEVLKADPSDGSWADILTDQIIAILSATECSSWIRNLCEKIFGSLLPHISQTSIDLLCDAIKAPLDDGSEDESEEEDDSDVEMNEDSNAMSATGTDDTKSMDESSAIEQDEDGDSMLIETDKRDEATSDQDDEETDEEENEGEEDNDDEDEEEEEYLDDEQMMKLDTVIADMFRLNQKSKKKNDPSFRLRLLDLVRKIVMKKHSDSETINTILAAIIPLATASKRTSETRPISNKIITMLSKMPGKSKYPKLVDFLDKHSVSKQ